MPQSGLAEVPKNLRLVSIINDLQTRARPKGGAGDPFHPAAIKTMTDFVRVILKLVT
jgi:hypothetical protein